MTVARIDVIFNKKGFFVGSGKPFLLFNLVLSPGRFRVARLQSSLPPQLALSFYQQALLICPCFLRLFGLSNIRDVCPWCCISFVSLLAAILGFSIHAYNPKLVIIGKWFNEFIFRYILKGERYYFLLDRFTILFSINSSTSDFKTRR